MTRAAIPLALRLVAARGFSVVALGIAAFVLNVRDFAIFGVYVSLVSLVWVAGFLRYENAIVAAPRPRQAGEVVRLCAVVGTGTWLCVTALASAGNLLGWVPGWAALTFPVALALRLTLRLAHSAATRAGDLTGLGRVIMVQAAVQAVALAVAVANLDNGALCLALTDAVGYAAAALYLTRRHAAVIGPALSGRWSIRALGIAARRWRALPLLNLPGSLLSLGFVSAPLLVMPALADPVTAGAVALAFRLFDVPTQVINATLAPVAMGRFGPSGETFSRNLLAWLATGIAGLYAIGALMLWAAIPWLRGTGLAELGPVLASVAAFQAGIALAAPLAEAGSLHRDQLRLALVNVAALGLAALAGLGTWLAGPQLGLAIFAVASLLRGAATGHELQRLTGSGRHAPSSRAHDRALDRGSTPTG